MNDQIKIIYKKVEQLKEKVEENTGEQQDREGGKERRRGGEEDGENGEENGRKYVQGYESVRGNQKESGHSQSRGALQGPTNRQQKSRGKQEGVREHIRSNRSKSG